MSFMLYFSTCLGIFLASIVSAIRELSRYSYLRLDRGISVKLLQWNEYIQLEQEREVHVLHCFQSVLFSGLQSLHLVEPYMCSDVSYNSKAVQAR